MRKKRGIIIAAGIIVGVAGTLFFLIPQIGKADYKAETGTVEGYVQSGSIDGETISVSGTTTAGTDYEYFPVSISSLLEVEDVYIESGAEVTTESAILKVTEESYREAGKKLKKALRDAKNELQQATIDYKVDLLSLQSEYYSEAAVTDTASEEYKIAIENLATEVEMAKRELSSALETINKKPTKISSTKTKLKAARKKLSASKDALTTLQKKYDTANSAYISAETAFEQAEDQWKEVQVVQSYVEKYMQTSENKTEKANAEVTPENTNMAALDQESDTEAEQDSLTAFVDALGMDTAKKLENYKKTKADYEEKKTKVETLATKIEKKESKIQDLETQISTLQTNLSAYQSDLKEAKKNVDALQAAYDQAKADEITGTVEAEKELQLNLLAEGSASVSYRLQAATLMDTLDSAQKAYDKAKENWEVFEDTFADGVWYAQSSGTVTYLGYEEGDFITNMSPILGYYNGDTISVEVTVDQSQIATIAVGDQVTVSTLTSRRGVTGTVSVVSSEQNSTSASKVTYGVTISMDNTAGTLTSGDTATVAFPADTIEDATYISARLVQSDSRGEYVTVINEDGSTEAVVITTGVNNGTYVEIKDGVSVGTHCIASKTVEQEEK